MKKMLFLLPLLLLLTGCGGKVIYGEVQSITPKGDYLELTIVGKEDTVLADDNTMVYSFAGIEEGLLDGELIRPYITAYDLRWTPDGTYSDRICVESVILPDPYVLEDGTELTVRKDYSHTTYFSPNGIDILWEQEPAGPHNVSVGGLPTFDMLNEQAQEAILAYYEEQGLLYDLDAELEKAYQEFLSMGNPVSFQARHLSQDISPTAANDKLIWYSIYVTRPIEYGVHQMTSTNTIFDRQTGAVVEAASLFTCSEAEAARVILDVCGMPDTDLRREMEQKFRFEYLNFSSNDLGVCFPAGSLVNHPGMDHMLGIRYTDISNILHPWAVPDSVE